MNHLGERVHAGVGASRAYRFDGLIRNVRESALEVILNPAAGGLSLPATKRRAVVLDTQSHSEAGHDAGPKKKNRDSRAAAVR
ncbi:MAG: hypothetical protein V7640_3741 [Betaproteobacteria bacterium]